MIWILSAVGAIVVSLAGRDAWGWLPRISRAVIWFETLPLPAERREIRREEWCAELAGEFDERRLTGLLWTLKLGPVALHERLAVPPRLPSLGRRSAVTAVARTLGRALGGVAVLGGAAALVAATRADLIRQIMLHPVRTQVLAVGALAVGACLTVYCVAAERKRVRLDNERRLAIRRQRTVRILEDLEHDPAAASLRASRELLYGSRITPWWRRADLPAEKRIEARLTQPE